MQIQLIQALATVLGINVVPVPLHGSDGKPVGFEHHFMSSGAVGLDLGVVGKDTLTQAVWRAMEHVDLGQPSNFAVFPITSHREDFYMAIEREMLTQEASDEFAGKQMWELLGEDPRQLVMQIMEQLRECAATVITPQAYQVAMLRTAVLTIASMQWTNNWIGRLRLRQAAMSQREEPAPPEPIPFPSETPPPDEPVPALFGHEGLHAVPESPEGGFTKQEAKEYAAASEADEPSLYDLPEADTLTPHQPLTAEEQTDIDKI